MRLYWGTVFVNLAISVFVVLPIIACECKCDKDHGVNLNELQCRALKSYERVTPSSAADSGSQCRPARGRRLAQSFMQSSPGTLSIRDQPSQVHPALKVQDDLAKALEEFESVQAGIEFVLFDPLDELEVGWCRMPRQFTMHSSPSANAFIQGLRTMHCQKNVFSMDNQAAQMFLDAALNCTEDPSCRVIRWVATDISTGFFRRYQFQACGLLETAVPRINQSRIEMARRCKLNNWNLRQDQGQNCSDDALEDCYSFEMHLTKTKKDVDITDLRPRVRVYCTIVNALMLVMFLSLSVSGLPMVIIIWKFIQEGCGDAFDTKNQFQVDFDDETVDDDDDFEVGSWVSLAERKGNSSRNDLSNLSTLPSSFSHGLTRDMSQGSIHDGQSYQDAESRRHSTGSSSGYLSRGMRGVRSGRHGVSLSQPYFNADVSLGSVDKFDGYSRGRSRSI